MASKNKITSFKIRINNQIGQKYKNRFKMVIKIKANNKYNIRTYKLRK
jgi:hypothetical protein